MRSNTVIAACALLGFGFSTPAHALLRLSAIPIGEQRVVFERFEGSGGLVGARATLPVSFNFAGREREGNNGGQETSGSGVASLNVTLFVAANAVRNAYPELIPGERYVNTRVGGAYSGNVSSIQASLTVFSEAEGHDVDLLRLSSATPKTVLRFFDFGTFHTSGRGAIMQHPGSGLKKLEMTIAGGQCHTDCFLRRSTENNYNFSSEIVDFSLFANNNYKQFGLRFSNPSDEFYNSSTDPFSIRINSFGFISSTPEPGTWALLIIGFGLVGASMRRARRSLELTS